MLFHVTLSLLLVGSATATIIHERSIDDAVSALHKRQYRFQPATQTATGNDCADAFGSGFTTCREATGILNRLCYNPAAGQTCCSASWSCPNGSGCSAGNYCCPTGQDAKACAAANAASSSSAKPSSTSSSSSYSSSSSMPNKTSSYISTPSAYHHVVSNSYPVKNVTSASHKVSPSATSTYAAPASTMPTVFQGAASNMGISFSGLMCGGVVGIMAVLL